MIDPTHLRIGNLVQHKTEIITVDSIGGFAINVNGSFEGAVEWDYHCEELEGIPLTPEWLERMGFEDSGRFDYVIITPYGDRLTANYNSISGEVHSFGITYEHELETKTTYNFAWHIKHVHQIQNLYHSLTSQELTIK